MNPNSDLQLSACETILLRQFDDDCRPGLPLPADVAAHLAGCANCQQEWSQHSAFDAQLRTQLQVAVPISVYRQAYQAAVEIDTKSPQPLHRHFRLLFAGLVGTSGALISLTAPYLSDWPWLAPIVFATAAVLTYVVEFASDSKTPAL